MNLASKFRVIPVLDVKQGIAVHGRAGRRDEYLPVQSILAPSSDPFALLLAMRESLRIEEVYLADLDAIVGGEPNWRLFHSLRQASVRIFVDAGIQLNFCALIFNMHKTGFAHHPLGDDAPKEDDLFPLPV